MIFNVLYRFNIYFVLFLIWLFLCSEIFFGSGYFRRAIKLADSSRVKVFKFNFNTLQAWKIWKKEEGTQGAPGIPTPPTSPTPPTNSVPEPPAYNDGDSEDLPF